jgi:hypothetical protein
MFLHRTNGASYRQSAARGSDAVTCPADQREPVVRQDQVVRADLAAPKCNSSGKRPWAPELDLVPIFILIVDPTSIGLYSN